MSYGQGGYGQGGYGQGGYGQGQGGYGGNSNPYGQAAGNPYGGSGGGYGQSNPYGQQSSYNQQRPAQSNPYGQQSSYNQQPQAAPAPQAYGNGGGGYGSQPAYSDSIPMNTMNEKSDIRATDYQPTTHLKRCKKIDEAADSITADAKQLQGLQQRAKDSVDGNPATNPVLKQIDTLSAHIMTVARTATDELRRLKGYPNAGDDMCAAQITRVDRKLHDAVAAYRKQDKEYQGELRGQLKRQYRIVRPDATETEINEAVEDTNAQIFSQALMQSDRRGQAQSALSAVKNRHAAIQKIEKDVEDLATLFQEMNEIIVTQEAQVQQIDQQATTVEQDVSGANVELAGAVTKARAARKKKWICLGIVVAIILIIVIVILAWGYGSGTFNNKKNN